MNTPVKLFALFVLSGIFLAISLHRLDLPGYYYDEGLYALPALQIIHNKIDYSFHNSFLNIKIPGMLYSYVGATQTYLLVPFMAISESFKMTRILPIFMALIVVWFTWWLCEILFNPKIALHEIRQEVWIL